LIRQSGLFIYNDKNNTYYDRFRDRLIFPIKNTHGQVIGFGGRTLSEDSRKYINSPKTILFNKGEVLYNLGEAKPHIKKI
jgi:DNA primase (bacterial type)